MSIKALEISVGLFILAGIFALVFMAFQVSGLNRNFDPDHSYHLYAKFNNVSGLTSRAKVLLGGVQVGRVEAISYDPVALQARVDMIINRDIDFLSTDTIAAIQTAGILGEKYVSLSPGGAEEVLADGDRIRETQSALVLEELVGKVLTNLATKP